MLGEQEVASPFTMKEEVCCVLSLKHHCFSNGRDGMFLINQQDGSLVEVLSLESLFNPSETEIRGRFHAGEELQDEEQFSKSELSFPSGECLPRCWVDSHYRDNKTSFIKQ
jgi:hypothetical protein